MAQQQPGESFLWDPSAVPGENEGSFRKLIRAERRITTPPEESQCVTWESAPNPETYSSIGDQGVTASINTYGELMQFGRYLGTGTHGMFCVDQSYHYTSEPYFVRSRASDLQTLSRDRISGIEGTFGLRFPDIAITERPKLSYVRYRWPRYEYRNESIQLSTQWMVHDGIVLQQCVVTNLNDNDLEVPFQFNNPDKSICIRDLDYLDSGNRFNDSYDGYSDFKGPHGYSWNVIHNLPSKKDEEDDTSTMTGMVEENNNDFSGGVAVTISVFLDGTALKWNDRTTSWTKSLKGNSTSANSPSSDTMEVVTAYKLVLLPGSTADWQNFIISVESVDVNTLVKAGPFSIVSLSSIERPNDGLSDKVGTDPEVPIKITPQKPKKPILTPRSTPNQSSSPGSHIEFVTRRNLEHILSVCAIPLTQPSVEGDQQSSTSVSNDSFPIALTCGDISGHRICTSASYFAFQFLIEAAVRLRQIEYEDDYVASLLERIASVCRGHLLWLTDRAERSKSGYFAANYWITGKIMTKQSGSWRPQDSLTDTAYQILKAWEYANLYMTEDDQDIARSAVRESCGSWVNALDKLDYRSSFAWPHAQEADTNVFRLDDHVWIWKALQSISGLGLWDPSKLEHTSRETLRKLAAGHVQREMLRRFTTENSVSRKRMLAVTRSSRETRFMFHASDSALFYGSDWDFFLEDTSFREVWINSIEAQAYHDGNQETGWDNALRYSLAIIMGTNGHRINKRSPADMVKSALSVLFQSTSPNGFFPGQLDIATKEPVLFYGEPDRDFYFHASFEIPFVLFTNAIQINAMYTEEATPPPKPVKRTMSELQAGMDALQHGMQATSPESDVGELSRRLTAQPKLQPLEKATERDYAPLPALDNKVLTMKKTVPYSRFVDSSTIVDVDEEWLYNYPAFLSNETEMSSKYVREQVTSLSDQGSGGAGHVIQAGVRTYLTAAGPMPPSDKTENFAFSVERESGMVVDTARKRNVNLGRQHKRNDEYYRLLNNAQLWEKLKEPRRAQNAKKRFIWLPNADAETALECYLSSPDQDKPAISLFFDRHSYNEKYFFDDTTMFLNTWETEFHLSFYQLLDSDGARSSGLPGSREDIFPGRQGRQITKASMGFRFMGDFFDRYWTCHFIECIPAKEATEEGLPKFPFSFSRDNKAWRQRKVLELYLFDRILGALVESTQEIYNEVRDEFGLRKGAFSVSISNSDDYFSADWQKFQHMLEAVEQELAIGLLIVSKWETRDKDRGQEKPRWTRNDEQNYGGYIKKLLGSTNRRIRDMQSLHANIKSLKETLISSQEHIRDDLGLRGAEDIRFFTYVTVVFLPLGFASSIFSLNGSPPGGLIASMAICAVVALAITLIALFNAKTIGVVIDQLSTIIDKYYGGYTRATMRRSAIVRRHKDKRRQQSGPQGEADTEKEEAHHRKKPNQKSTYFWFWLAYILVELPARRVLLGYGALKANQLTWSACYNVATAILLLPFCILSWVLQVVAYNLADVFRFCWDWAIWIFPSSSDDDDGKFWDRMKWLTHPPPASRPVKLLNSQMAKFRTNWGNDGPGATEDEPKKLIKKTKTLDGQDDKLSV